MSSHFVHGLNGTPTEEAVMKHRIVPSLWFDGNAEEAAEFSEAISLMVTCADQQEVDYYWERLGEGGEEGPCGWLKDRYGLSWQVVPEGMDEVFADPDPDRAARAMQAMLPMGKLDVATLRAAADGVPVA